MKTIVKWLVLPVFAAGVTAGCSKNEFTDPANPEGIRIVADADIEDGLSKTSIEWDAMAGAYRPLWSDYDKIGLFMQMDGTLDNVNKYMKVLPDWIGSDGRVARFTGYVLYSTPVGPHDFYTYYPHDIRNNSVSDLSRVQVTISPEQEPDAASFDGRYDILWGRPEVVEVVKDASGKAVQPQLELYFKRLSAVVRLDVSFEDGKVRNISDVTLNVPSRYNITGSRYLDIRTGILSETGLQDKGSSVRAVYGSGIPSSSGVLLNVFPASFSAGDEISVTVKGSGFSVTRTMKLKRNVAFNAGEVAVIDVVISNDDMEGGISPGPGETDDAGWLELPLRTGNEDYVYTLMAGRDRNYTYYYDAEMYSSMWVAYPLYAATMGGSRKGSWKSNPDIPVGEQINIWDGSYGVSVGSTIYSRGHQIPDGDRSGNQTMQSQTYYATNSTPQIQDNFNGGIWNDLENAVRDEAMKADTIYVVTGPLFKKTGGSETVRWITPKRDSKQCPVPNYYWKVLLKVKRSGGNVTSASAVGFWFDHKEYTGASRNFRNCAVSVDEIERFTGLDLFHNLPDNIELVAESNRDWDTFCAF